MKEQEDIVDAEVIENQATEDTVTPPLSKDTENVDITATTAPIKEATNKATEDTVNTTDKTVSAEENKIDPGASDCKCDIKDPEHLLEELKRQEDNYNNNDNQNNTIEESNSSNTSNTNNTSSSNSITGNNISNSNSNNNISNVRRLPPKWVVPPIGTRGIFNFEEPFNSKLYDGIEYEVKAIRSLTEMRDSKEEPYENIYQQFGLTDTDFMIDVNYKVPIIVLSNSAGDYYYVPATKLKAMPKVTGVRYQEYIMAVNVGHLPLNYNFNLIKDMIQEDIYSTLGIVTTVEVVPTSATVMVSNEESKKFMEKLDNKKTVKLSYRTRYEKLTKENEALKKQMELLYKCITNHLNKKKEIEA